MKALDQKHLLKVASRELIPETIRRRPKQPYRAPDGKCFFGPHSPDYAADLLSPEAVRRFGLFDPQAVSLLVDKFQKNRAIGVKDNMAMIGVLSTQLLVQQFIDRFKEAPQSCNIPTLSVRSAISS
jgi:asparagine synthase (glutamine-hydrolysing)